MTPDGMVGPATRAALLGGSDGSGTVSYVQKLGSNGALARYLQHMLNVLGYQITIDGVFSEETKNVVLSFQTTHGLDTDGQVGPATWAKLFGVYSVPVNGTGLERFVNIAKYEADWGYHEDNENNITPYGQWYGLNGNAWCAMFVSLCAHYAGITDTLVPKYSWCPSGVSWYKSKGRYHVSGNGYVPKIGDIIFFYNAQAGRVSHTGIVIDGTTTHVSTIEGNSSDGVRHKIYNLTDSSIDGYGDNGGTPIHSNKPHATEDEINLKMKEYFHDLLLPLGVDEEITDGILKNGLSIPSGIPGLTFSVTLNQDITLENNGKYLSIENGELVLEQDANENLSIILAHITPSTYDTIISTLNTFAFSFNNEICKTFFSINAVEKQLEFGLQVSKNVQILDGVSREVVVEYKITYKISDKNTPQEVALYDSLNEINTNISTINNKQVSTYLLIFIIIIFFVFCSKIPIAINGPLEVCAQIIEGIDNFNNI